ncbi:transglutaminase family protein [Brevundimonas sp. A19_0]|uniref:transglutaminase family protein n=1 Tax=Brevundimonas sp. A19_0 TaxID=2821087 RepID=UPI001ADBDB4C|nr:transglutaminase family protein [Brevundimonas sp. A19_0]MBO9500388.1 transglutaminase family protein [Brevundimonas sp. A19_0]
MRVKVRHSTEYTYDQAVSRGLQKIRLTPKNSGGQTVVSWHTGVEGGTKELSYTDQHNNLVELLSIAPGTRTVTIVCEGEVDTSDTAGIIGQHGGYAPLWYFRRSTPQTRAGPRVRQLVRDLGKDFDDDPSRLHALSALILDSVTYSTGTTDFATTAEQAIEAGQGVCQDHAHILIAAARLMGYPARYVSGYLMMDDRVDQDAGHAWAEVHVDGLGWVGFDVSNGVSPDPRYVRVATGLDYGEAAPISGIVYGGRNESMVVQLQVQQ